MPAKRVRWKPVTLEWIQINLQLISAQLTAQFWFLCLQHHSFSYSFFLFWRIRAITTYKLGYIFKENKALTVKKNLHRILYLNVYKEDTSQFCLVEMRGREENKLIVTLNSWVPKNMTNGTGYMQQSMKCLNLNLRIFQGCMFYIMHVFYSPSTSKGWKGVNYICFLKMDVTSKISRIEHEHSSLLYTICSMPHSAQIKGTNLELSDLFIFHLLSC